MIQKIVFSLSSLLNEALEGLEEGIKAIALLVLCFGIFLYR